VLKLFEYSCLLGLSVCCVNGTQPRVLESKSDSLRWPYAVHSVRVSLRVRLVRTRDKVRWWFPGGPCVTLSPPISPFPIDYLRGSRCVTPDFLLAPAFWLELVSVPTSRLT
jgi:hypothetical protein